MSHKAAYSIRINGVPIKQYQFDNGYGASVHKPPGARGWILGVTSKPTDDLLESSPVFLGAVKEGLSQALVDSYLDQIRDLPQREVTNGPQD